MSFRKNQGVFQRRTPCWTRISMWKIPNLKKFFRFFFTTPEKNWKIFFQVWNFPLTYSCSAWSSALNDTLVFSRAQISRELCHFYQTTLFWVVSTSRGCISGVSRHIRQPKVAIYRKLNVDSGSIKSLTRNIRFLC